MSVKTASPVISRMHPDEADRLSVLFERVVSALPYYNEKAKRSEVAQYGPQTLRQSALDDPDSVMVAKLGSDLVGFCISRDDDGVIWLAWFGVDSSARCLGIGSALLQDLELTARRGRSHKIWCDCRTDNEASKRILSRHGFKPVCTLLKHWYGQDFILWEKFV